MPSPIFNAMQEQKPQNRGMELVQKYNQFRQNPIAFIGQMRGVNIPMEYRDDPQKVVQYLMNSGKMTQNDIEAMKNMAQKMGIEITL